ncbi:hypothetical protein [Ornithinimicrobium cavernae]|uniref:hypothetical protein n=1 Tax=Ornithinimicrobium cavernae TaxID=2666047 RepID=UPI0012B1725F|nr:hypothetical protein [Ornithinimicrobium cavernae]
MVELSGEITSHVAALGAGTRDRRVFAILTRDPHFIEDAPVTGDDGVVRIDIANIMEGVLLRFRDGALDTVTVFAQREGDYYPYPRPAELITGLDIAAAAREDVTGLLGEPAEASSDHAAYAVDGGRVTVAFVGDRPASVTVSRG